MRLAVGTTLLFLLACSAPRPAPVEAPVAQESDVQIHNDSVSKAVLARIAGKEQLPAGQVFENVQYLATVNARTLIGIMNGGYAKALGVKCSHCHVETNFASEELRPKLAAREMQVMHRSINQQLAGMQHIKTPATANRAISCIACHRGTIIPRP